MTLIVGLHGKDAIVVASDSRAYFKDEKKVTCHDDNSKKIYIVRNVAICGAGAAYTNKLVDEIEKTTKVGVTDIMNEVYYTLNGIVNRTGIAKEDIYTFVLKELLDNAVDDVEKSSNPLVEAEISTRNDVLYIVVRNLNESNKVVFSKVKLDSIFNLSKFTSSKHGLFRISRGALGDAMKYILGMPYALAKELHVSIEEAPLTIRTNQQVFSVKLNVVKGDVKEEKQEHSDWTEVEVRLPIAHKFLDFNKIKLFLADYVLFSTHISFKFRVGDETMLFSQTQPNNKKWVNNSSSHYYSQTEFEYFIDEFDDDNAEVCCHAAFVP